MLDLHKQASVYTQRWIALGEWILWQRIIDVVEKLEEEAEKQDETVVEERSVANRWYSVALSVPLWGMWVYYIL